MAVAPLGRIVTGEAIILAAATPGATLMQQRVAETAAATIFLTMTSPFRSASPAAERREMP